MTNEQCLFAFVFVNNTLRILNFQSFDWAALAFKTMKAVCCVDNGTLFTKNCRSYPPKTFWAICVMWPTSRMALFWYSIQQVIAIFVYARFKSRVEDLLLDLYLTEWIHTKKYHKDVICFCIFWVESFWRIDPQEMHNLSYRSSFYRTWFSQLHVRVLKDKWTLCLCTGCVDSEYF